MRLVNDSKSTARVTVSLSPGAVLEVGELVGAALVAQGLTDAGDLTVGDGIPEGELAELAAANEAALDADVIAEEVALEVAEAELDGKALDDEEGYVTLEAEVDEAGEVTELVTEELVTEEPAPKSTRRRK